MGVKRRSKLEKGSRTCLLAVLLLLMLLLLLLLMPPLLPFVVVRDRIVGCIVFVFPRLRVEGLGNLRVYARKERGGEKDRERTRDKERHTDRQREIERERERVVSEA